MEGPVRDEQDKAAALALVSTMKSELRSLKLREAELTNRIRLLHTTISGLAYLANLAGPLIEETPSRPRRSEWPDLTEDCASLLNRSPGALTIGEICSQLVQNTAFGKKPTVDPLLAIWISLQQLARYGFVQVSEADGIRRWSWIKSHTSERSLTLPIALGFISNQEELARREPGQIL
jgi:hypothetical protein